MAVNRVRLAGYSVVFDVSKLSQSNGHAKAIDGSLPVVTGVSNGNKTLSEK
jgi:hypothetical protein